MPYNFVADSFHTGVTAEELRAKIDRKSAISLQRGHFDPKFQVQELPWKQNLGKSQPKLHLFQLCAEICHVNSSVFTSRVREFK